MNASSRLLALSLLFFCGCGSGPTYNNQIDFGRTRNNAKMSLVGDGGSIEKTKAEDERIRQIKDGIPGLTRTRQCVESGPGMSTLLFNTPECYKFENANWLKLSWSCPGEENAFYRPKTSKVARAGVAANVLNKQGVSLDVIHILLNSSYESFDSVSDEVFDHAERLQVSAGGSEFLAEKASWSQTLLFPAEICR